MFRQARSATRCRRSAGRPAMVMKLVVLATGDSIHSRRWVSFFAQRHEVHWVSLGPFADRPADEVPTYEIAGAMHPLAAVARGALVLRRLLRRLRPDVFHVHSAGTNGLVATLAGYHPRVVTAWGSEVLITARSPVKRPLVAWSLRSADLVTCDAEHMREAIRALGVDCGRIRIVHFGTDVQKFRPGLDAAELRRQVGAADRPIVLSSRSLEPLYDVESLIRAVPLVLRAVPRAMFVIVGDGSEAPRLKRLTADIGVATSVHFVGRIANDDLPRYLNAADAYVSTALSDAGLSASTAEAMASGLPVVVTDSGENRRWVVDGSGGFVVPVRAPDELAGRITSLLECQSDRLRYGAFNRAVIEARNNYDVEMTKMETMYHALATHSGVG